MLPASIIHVLHYKATLRAFTDISEHDLFILGILRILNCPVNYTALHARYAALGYGHNGTLTSSLRYCESMNYVIRECIGINVSYYITSKGKELLDRINTRLDNCVKEQSQQYDSIRTR